MGEDRGKSSSYLIIDSDKQLNYEQSVCVWSVKQSARDTQITSRVTALVSRVSRLRPSLLARACTPLTKTEEKERLLTV